MADLTLSTALPAELMPAPLDAEALADEMLHHEGLVEGLAEARTPWRIEDDREAEWAGRKYAAAVAKIEDVGIRAEEWHAQINAWASAERRGAGAEFFKALLIDYARRRREADPKAKTLRLPSVTVSSRGTDQPKAVVVDDETVCNWLRGQGLDAYLSVKYSPKRRELAEGIEVKRVPGMTSEDGSQSDPDYYYVALLDGEEVPGVEVQEPTVTFTVKPAGGA